MMEACVVGASTGGVSALRSLLRGLDKGFRPSVIIVQHTATEGFNVLVDLLRDSCVLPVSEAQSREPIQPGHVYLAPPRYHLLVERQHRFALSVDERVCHVRPAADVLFQSAAEVWRERLAAVVLTGANDDGARGAALVRSLGGTLIVQDPQEAEAPEMPAAALRLAGADHVLPLNRIAPMLLKLAGRANA
ncbi:chemotaxis protein CheB [Solimonas sp. SE-A11]|uniref:chemotaxis protein CheB n=1 Tax=Solimonas sp. SE-A11 TaxID=3054954 RepID=UPI00259D2DD3|nr:chemotaxis protein CheB [Solimonas sp. SE-A11]MDM4769407.1 chemotaxis protein CheB [Solimonas sp. SE-A11]